VSQESTTPDLVELGRRFFEAANRRDFDAMLSFFAPDAVWEGMGLRSTFEGVAAIRGFWQEWFGSYEDWEITPEQMLDLGNGVGFAVVRQTARPVGSDGRVQTRMASVSEWLDAVIVRFTVYYDIGQARAAAQCLAEERAQADV
jgi:ketosteroid isomerase-like protein